jgi:hypothetical protein
MLVVCQLMAKGRVRRDAAPGPVWDDITSPTLADAIEMARNLRAAGARVWIETKEEPASIPTIKLSQRWALRMSRADGRVN